MNVIRHDYVTTNGDVEVARMLGISYKCRVHITARQKWLPQVGAKGHKIERARVKEATETRGTTTETLLHAETCSHSPVSRPIITSHSSRSSNGAQRRGYNVYEIALGFRKKPGLLRDPQVSCSLVQFVLIQFFGVGGVRNA